MTPEELDKARVEEACRVAAQGGHSSTLLLIARLAREGWTPPVDPDLLAFREWAGSFTPTRHLTISDAYFAGARMAREQEQERAKVLVEYVTKLVNGFFLYADYRERASAALAAYARPERPHDD
jgi:hypothetical protein